MEFVVRELEVHQLRHVFLALQHSHHGHFGEDQLARNGREVELDCIFAFFVDFGIVIFEALRLLDHPVAAAAQLLFDVVAEWDQIIEVGVDLFLVLLVAYRDLLPLLALTGWRGGVFGCLGDLLALHLC